MADDEPSGSSRPPTFSTRPASHDTPDDACINPQRYDAVVGTDLEVFLPIPDRARRFTYAAFTTNDGADLPVAIHVELSWVEKTVALADAGETSFKIPLRRDRDGIAVIDGFYYTGPAGFGEHLKVSPKQKSSKMSLYLFIEGSALPAAGSASLFIEWEED